jgi:hypothetical protein
MGEAIQRTQTELFLIANAAIAAHESGALERVVFETSTDDDYDAIQRIIDAIGGKDAATTD